MKFTFSLARFFLSEIIYSTDTVKSNFLRVEAALSFHL